MTTPRAGAVESVDALPEAARSATRDLLLCIADSKRILGLRYADWILGAPELEAGIAASGMAQDEWGHARILYALLKDFGDDPQEIEHGRPASHYRAMEPLDRPWSTWPEFIAANVLVDTALTVVLESLADGALAPVASRLRKQIEEERFHFAHGVAWLRRLAGPDATPASREAMAAGVRGIWPTVLLWLGPADSAAGSALADAAVLA
ncbi:MAG: Phenylacetic acid catabolic protein, partial [Gemmatimonadota bacterium]